VKGPGDAQRKEIVVVKINLMSDRGTGVDNGPTLGQQLDAAAAFVRDALFYGAIAFIAGALLWKLFVS
jgi:hypothetical protein